MCMRSELYRCPVLGSRCRCALNEHAPACGTARELGQATRAGQCLHTRALPLSTEQSPFLTAAANNPFGSYQVPPPCERLAGTTYAAWLGTA